jgi:hypothetical protein
MSHGVTNGEAEGLVWPNISFILLRDVRQGTAVSYWAA